MQSFQDYINELNGKKTNKKNQKKQNKGGNEMDLFKWAKRGTIGVVVFVMLLIGWFSFTETIPQGHVGVVYSRADGVQDETLSQGLKFVSPLVRITAYPVSTETVKHKEIKLSTKDGKSILGEITYDYYNDTEKLPSIYNKFKGQEPDVIEDSWLKARLTDSALSVTSNYKILEVFQNLESISAKIEEKFREDVKEHGFIIEKVVFKPEADDDTQRAIQEVVNQQQQLEALKIETQKAEETARKQLIEAEGKANAEIERARGEAEANRITSESITDNILRKMELEARLQHGWVEINGANGVIVDSNK